MSAVTDRPRSVFEMVLSWASARPAWQRDALRRIVAKGKLDEDDLLELSSLCKKGCGADGIELEAIPIGAEHVPAARGDLGSVALASVSDVVGVNRLAPGQTLAFRANGLTVIYGNNGVGKSGYARILKRACRARFPGEILPNAFDPGAARNAAATIAYLSAVGPAAVRWEDGSGPHPVLSAVSVFDRDCARVHVAEKNEVAFRPFGLDIPDELAGLCVQLKDLLQAELKEAEAARDAAFTKPAFSADTAVGRMLANLSAQTDLGALAALRGLSDEEMARLKRLNEDISKDPAKAAAEQRALGSMLARMADGLGAQLAATSDDALIRLLTLAEDAREKRRAAQAAAAAAFGGAAITGVGERAWRSLWEAARRYSAEAAFPGDPFPKVEDALCLLCHQPVSAEAGRRMTAFEAFVQADTERQAAEAEKASQDARRELAAHPVRISAFAQRRQLMVDDPDLAARILRALAVARLRRALCLKAVADGTGAVLPEPAGSPVQALRNLAGKAARYADELATAATADGRKRLERERDELRDRLLLEELFVKAEAEVRRLRTVALLKRCLEETATNAITSLGNAIADQLITPRVRDRFEKEIQNLSAARVRVDIVRSGGRYGSPQYQVRLFDNDKAKVASVLSEGEQTCVALAAFLTELSTASHKSTLVFDDPVSSLDHRWRKKVAERLVEEAGNRQIIVFTHDLVFLNDLLTLADQHGVGNDAVWLAQTTKGAGVVNSGLPWVGAKVKERVDELEKEARGARALYEAQDDEGYAEAAYRIYSRLRSTWERALEDVAFCNVLNRHRDYINAKDLMKVVALTEADVEGWSRAFKKCCDQTDAHDPARGRNAAPPPPDEVLSDVQQVLVWVSGLRARQKALSGD